MFPDRCFCFLRNIFGHLKLIGDVFFSILMHLFPALQQFSFEYVSFIHPDCLEQNFAMHDVLCLLINIYVNLFMVAAKCNDMSSQ